MHQFHLLHKVSGPGVLVDNKQHIAYIDHNIAANGEIIIQVTHCAFPDTVKIQTDQVSIGIKRGTSGITACSMIGADKATRLLSL